MSEREDEDRSLSWSRLHKRELILSTLDHELVSPSLHFKKYEGLTTTCAYPPGRVQG